MIVSNVFTDKIVRDGKYSELKIERMYDYPAKTNVALLHKQANEFGFVPKSSDKNSK